MNTGTVQEGKTIAIISYITFIGTIIAYIMNQNKKNSFASFHIRQAVGIAILGVAISILRNYMSLGIVGSILSIGVLVLSIIGIISAVQGEEKRIPLLGDQFQEWFKSIG
ncbi:MAG: hypothetical protein DRJ07_15070 [Bacteroidetes bacterium]|nr:MAG: hypothetical protein DRJ07_15070 [Bacteroidota bacterium]